MKYPKTKIAAGLIALIILCTAAGFLFYSCVNPMGQIIGTPEISIIYEEKVISTGGIFSFGEIVAGADRPELSFTIKNQGKTDLTLPSGVLITGTSASMFQLRTPPPDVITPGEQSTFSIAFIPFGTGGVKEAAVSIETNDKTIGTFTFTVQGTFSGVEVYLTTTSSNPTNQSPIRIDINFTEEVENFTIDDIQIDNGSAFTITKTARTSYYTDITPTGDGNVVVSLPEGSVTAVGTAYTNIAADPLSIFYDGSNPTGSVSINNGAAYTNSLITTLTLTASDGNGTGIKQMMVANTSDFFNRDWEKYSSSRQWTLTSGADGSRAVFIKFRDYVGNTSIIYTDSIILDATPPAQPSTLDLAAEDDSGDYNDDNITRQSTSLTFIGTAEAGALIKLYSNIDGLVGSGYADSSGNFRTDANLSFSSSGDRVHSITATATDTAGNVSPASSGLSVTIQPPAISSVFISTSSNPADPPNIPTAIFTSEPLQLYAYGVQTGDSTIDITELATWTCSSSTVATISSKGLLTGISAGTVTVTATTVNAEGTTLSYTTANITVTPSGGIEIGLE